MPLVALLIAAAFLPGCILELLTTTAIQGELQAQNAAAATQQLAHAQKMAHEIEVRQAIDAYRAENGTNPPSLAALVPDFLAAVPMDASGRPVFAYDPATGWFGDPVPGGTAGAPTSATVTAQDRTNLEALSSALNDYYAWYREYPQQLADLAPRFIDTVPTQSDGRPYHYVPVTGEVRHTAELQSAAAPAVPRSSSAHVRGGSPAAEQVQAIGIMNELNAQPAPSADPMRRQVQDVTTQQNDRYESVLDDLNL